MKIGVISQHYLSNSKLRQPELNCEKVYEVNKMGQSSLLEDYIIELDQKSLSDQK